MALFGNGNIVPWADPGEWIPLRCRICGAMFTTKNLNYIGYRTIHYGYSPGDKHPFDRAQQCERDDHPLRALEPDGEAYQAGFW